MLWVVEHQIQMHIKVVLAVVVMVEVGAVVILVDKLTLAGPRGEGK